MKSTTQSRLNAVGASLLTVALLAGCSGGSNEPAETNGNQPADGGTKTEPTTISLIQPDLGRVWKADNPGTKELESRTNVKLNVSMHPNNDFTSKFNVLAASGDVPDISRLSAFDYQNFADQGLF
ncbi:MAG: Bacterial extracellular solute-binding protein, partial [Paenibacillus sp.]|nr:Bacterial extracellular solute-binding protein [Paenibacillus sp.]